MGTPSTKPEGWGVDFCWFLSDRTAWAGVQRKEMRDLVASIRDGRLGKELVQGQELAFRLLVTEGDRPKLVNDHFVIDKWTKMSVAEWYGVLWKCQSEGWFLTHADSMQDTATAVMMFQAWTKRQEHGSLTGRTGVPKNSWGRRESKDFQRHLLMGLDKVGPELADRVLDKFGGVPWEWTVTVEELMEVPGIGRKKAEAMMGAFGLQTSSPTLKLIRGHDPDHPSVR